ncbi:MAG: hypothetical protein WCI75_18360, partial [candidate division NC10 bacterium]
MRKVKLLGLLCVAAAAAVLCYRIAQSQNTTKRALDVDVALRPAPQNIRFTCNPINLGWSGAEVEMSWSADGAVSGTITDIGAVEPAGTKKVSLGACSGCSKKYIFTAANEDGITSSAEQTVRYASIPPPAPRDDCFLAGTKILLEDGSYKNIEDV